VFVLRSLFGNLTSGIVRLAIVAGVLLVGYLLVVRPALRETDDAIRSSGLEQIGRTLDAVGAQVQHEIRHALHLTKARGGNPKRLIHCIEHSHQDVERIERCTRRF
jgi:hypothetical protein